MRAVPEAVAIEAAVGPVRLDELPEGVALWSAWLDWIAPVNDALHKWLSPPEQLRAARFHFNRDRDRYVAARSVLRWLLGRLLDVHPASVEITCDALGKPLLVSTGVPPLHFNVSHSEGLAVYAFSDACEVGVDVEQLRAVPEAESIMELYFSKPEAERWRLLTSERRPEAFLQRWVRFEARAKRSGLGLAQSGNDRPGLDPNELVFDFVPAAGFVGAVAF